MARRGSVAHIVNRLDDYDSYRHILAGVDDPLVHLGNIQFSVNRISNARKDHMRNLLVTLLLLAPLTGSAADCVCENLAGMAKSAAVARDNGHSLKAALSVVNNGDDDTDKLVRNTIRRVYSSRALSPEEIEEIYLSKCME